MAIATFLVGNRQLFLHCLAQAGYSGVFYPECLGRADSVYHLWVTHGHEDMGTIACAKNHIALDSILESRVRLPQAMLANCVQFIKACQHFPHRWKRQDLIHLLRPDQWFQVLVQVQVHP